MEASLNTQLRHMRREFDDIYRRIIETVHERSKDNGYVLNQAVREAMQEFAANGITGFTDLAGRRWGLYEYTNMAMRTAIHRAGLQATIDVMHQQNIDLCYVTQHEGACPLCTPWYGRVMSLSGRSYGFPSVQDAMNAGLFHPNCMDVLQPYIPGVSDLNAGVPVGWTLEDTRRRYAASQRQRAYEREIRKWKRVQAAAGTPEEERIARAHIVELQRRIRALTAENSLPRQYDREGGKVLLSEDAKKIKPFALDENGRVVTAEGLKGGGKSGILRTAQDLEWLKRGYEKAVERGDISALTGFEQYVKTAEEIEKKLVGTTTADNVEIKEYTTHFIDRIVGSYEQKREPVLIKDVAAALEKPQNVISRGTTERIYIHEKNACKVGVNPSRGRLVQVSPKQKGG